jgi:hypothetical protein
LPFLTEVPLRRHDVLANENDEIEHIYFPHRGVVSLVVNMRGGQVAETTTVGPGRACRIWRHSRTRPRLCQ